MDNSHQDEKIKYWRYKLHDKQRTPQPSKPSQNQSRKISNKSPEKKFYLPQEDYLTSTLRKLKQLLSQPLNHNSPAVPVSKAQSVFQKQVKMETNPKNISSKKRKKKDAHEGGKLRKDTVQKGKEGRKKSKQVSYPSNEGLNRSKQVLYKKSKEKIHHKTKQSPKKEKSRSKSEKYRIQKGRSSKNGKESPQKTGRKGKKKVQLRLQQTLKRWYTMDVQKNNDETESVKSIQNSVIIYDVSPQKEVFGNFDNFDNRQQRFQNAVEVIQRYSKGFLEYKRIENKILKKSFKNLLLRQKQNGSDKNSVNLQDMILQQETKWLRLKQSLQLLKNSGNSKEHLQQIIREVDENHKKLVKVQTVKANPKNQISLSDRRQINLFELQQQEQVQLIRAFDYEQATSLKFSVKMRQQIFKNHQRSIAVKKNQIYQELPKSVSNKSEDIQPQRQDMDIFSIREFQNSKNNFENMIHQIYEDDLMQEEQKKKEEDKYKEEQKEKKEKKEYRDKDQEQFQAISEYILDYLIDQSVRETPKAQIKYLLGSNGDNNFQLDISPEILISYDQKIEENQLVSTILATDLNILQLVQQFFHYCSSVGLSLPFRISHPLGVNSTVFLRCMRALNQNSENQQDFELGEESQKYQIIIAHQQFRQFEETYGINTDQNPHQYFFNQCVFDCLNYLFDEMRPFGKRGLPPICFQSNFRSMRIEDIKDKIETQMKKIIDIRLGILNFQNEATSNIDEIVNISLRKFKNAVIREIQDQYKQKSEDFFEIAYDLMNFIEEYVIEQEIILISQLKEKKKTTI